jgi:hypothetical protein
MRLLRLCETIGGEIDYNQALHNYLPIIVVNILIDIHQFGYTQRDCIYKIFTAFIVSTPPLSICYLTPLCFAISLSYMLSI